MSFRFDDSMPSPESFGALFETTGWNEEYRLTNEELGKVLSRSWYVVTAFESDRLVGIGRVVSDGILHAMIYDLIVHPDFRRRGLGGEILDQLVDACTRAGVRDIQLFCARGKMSFYENHGFRTRPHEAPGMELCGHRSLPLHQE